VSGPPLGAVGVLACEPTGHRWKPLVVTARARKIPVVCVQPLLMCRAREGEDFTRGRPDFGDAVIIARLTAELRCYVPYLPEGPRARLHHLGAQTSPGKTRRAGPADKDHQPRTVSFSGNGPCPRRRLTLISRKINNCPGTTRAQA
jgi:hypothetical protein